jgi:putative intracellular protease/amidase
MNNRREMILSALAAALTPAAAVAAGDDAASQTKAHHEKLAKDHSSWMGNETVAMLLYPQFTALDFFGPHHMFGNLMGAKVMLVAETADPVASDMGVKIVPTTSFADCPEKLTILFVPGGTSGTIKAAESPTVRRFLRERGAKAEWVTSVCTGSIVLGAAGLLRGYKATSHWAARDQLALFGAIPVDARVVVDRNRVTGAGVTSGLDFGLSLVEKIRGTEYAQSVQLLSEYDPKPPLEAGSDKKAPKQVVAMMREMLGEFNVKVEQLAMRVRPDEAAK